MQRKSATAGQEIVIDPSWRIGIVFSSYYPEEVRRLVDGARKTLEGAGIPAANIEEYATAGAFEIPLMGSVLAEVKAVDALIGIGIIVQGETEHADLIADACARGMMDVQVRFGIPFAFEVLHVDDLEQAKARAAGPDSKGEEAARAVLHSLAQIAKLHS